VLLKPPAKATAQLQRITGGDTIVDIASGEGPSVEAIRSALDLALLSPRIVKAVCDRPSAKLDAP